MVQNLVDFNLGIHCRLFRCSGIVVGWDIQGRGLPSPGTVGGPDVLFLRGIESGSEYGSLGSPGNGSPKESDLVLDDRRPIAPVCTDATRVGDSWTGRVLTDGGLGGAGLGERRWDGSGREGER